MRIQQKVPWVYNEKLRAFNTLGRTKKEIHLDKTTSVQSRKAASLQFNVSCSLMSRHVKRLCKLKPHQQSCRRTVMESKEEELNNWDFVNEPDPDCAASHCSRSSTVKRFAQNIDAAIH